MSVPSDWWQTFFSGPVVDWWLQATSAEQTQEEIDFIQKILQTSAPARLLDVPCGGGRHSIALAQRGYAMTGVDLSDGFLKAARSSSGPTAGKLTWEQREMRDLPWTNEFDGAFSFGNSFAYLDEAGNADFLKVLFRVLKPGARFVLDTSYVMEGLLPALRNRDWYQIGDILILSDRRYEPETSRLEVEYTSIHNGKVDKRAMTARVYAYREVQKLFEEAGFRDVQGFGSFAQEPYKLGSPHLLMVGIKV